MHKALFLDRDGVINVDHGYVYRQQDFQFMPGILESCAHFHQAGYKLIVVTNQSGIARGMYTPQDFCKLTVWMKAQFAQAGAALTDVLYCPHHPAGDPPYNIACQCRKPLPGMLLDAAAKHHIDLSGSCMVGDSERDMQAALAAGIPWRVLVSESSAVKSCATHIIASPAELAMTKATDEMLKK